MKILVLLGGESAERVVSLASGDAVSGWLAEAGYDVRKYDPAVPGKVNRADVMMAPLQIGAAAPLAPEKSGFSPQIAQGLINVLAAESPDLVFPILHGGWGEDGTVQGLLDWVGVPYVGSGMLASAMAMDKEVAKIVMRSEGVPVAQGFSVPLASCNDIAGITRLIEKSFGFPVVVKPRASGSAVGVSIVRAESDLADALNVIESQQADALIEQYFQGREMTATVVLNQAYPLIEIRPRDGFYDYHNKYTAGRTEYLCPAPVAESTARQIQDCALRAFHSLGCSGFARIDFLLGANDEFICLEVNTLPGMTKTSLVPKSAAAHGVSAVELMKMLVLDRLSRVKVSA